MDEEERLDFLRRYEDKLLIGGISMREVATKEEFNEVILDGKTIVVFSADWCPDCVVIKPILPEIDESYSEFRFIYVDRDKQLELCQDLGIFGIPSFVAFAAGEEIGRYVNKERKSKQQIESFIESL
jgi:thiol-disulfide isomerase/thioredoxin